VKPANILVISRGAISQFDWQFKLADFGLSHFTIRKSSEEEATATDSQGTRTYGA
jgi:serine/threonine protein kinase